MKENTKRLSSKLVMWYKILMGVVGVTATVVWFVFIVGSPVVVTLGGVPVLGSIGFMCILLGNGYGLWCLGASGLADYRKRKHIENMAKSYSAYWSAMREEDNE
jgi:hypothetical protein